MDQQRETLHYLFSRYANNLSTKAEYDAFLQIINDAESDAELQALLGQLWEELENQNQTPKRSFIYKLLPCGTPYRQCRLFLPETKRTGDHHTTWRHSP